jgi:Tol biopolymer transport system component
MNRLDKVALSVILLLVVTLITVAWIGNPRGLQVTIVQDEGIGPLGPITLEFSQPVNVNALSGMIILEPQGISNIESISSRRVNLTPGSVISSEVPATLRLNPGAYGINGEFLRTEQSWVVSVRPSQIAFLGTEPQPREIFRVALDGSPPVQLTQTGGRIWDFNVAPNGEQIIYSLINDQGGVDLWQIGRNGQNNHLLLNCGPDRCITPAFSPDSKLLAYTREAAGIAPDAPPGAPRPWVLDLTSGQNAPVYADNQTIGYDPSWSPAGSRMASWDGVNGGIRVLDLQTGEETLLPTESGEVGGWSPDGTQMLFTRYEPVDQGYYAFIYRADFNKDEESTFLPGGQSDSAYGTPAWSPDGARIAFSLRTSDKSPARSIWIVQPDFLGGPMIGGEPDFTYGFYRWNPWSTALVFQRTRLGGQPNSEIAVYQLDTGKIQVLSEGGSWPYWLP